MKEYDAYLFDADGTLMDTKELIYRCFVYMGEQVGAAMPGREEIVATIGLPVTTQIRDFLGPAFSGDDRERAFAIYRDYMDAIYPEYITLFPGVREGLEALAARGKLLAVVTSRRRRSLVPFLAHLGIDGFFPVLVTPDETARHKPDPEPALAALALLGVEAKQAVFIGDASFDVDCAKGAGVDAAFVAWGGNDATKLIIQPDFIAERFEDLLPEK